VKRSYELIKVSGGSEGFADAEEEMVKHSFKSETSGLEFLLVVGERLVDFKQRRFDCLPDCFA